MWIFSAIIYYLVIIPISLLPFRVLYLFSDFIFLIVYHLIGFRKKVVMQNLINSFPEKSEAEIKDLANKFYRHFCDLIVESVKLFTISQDDVVARFKFINPQVLDDYFDKGQSILITGGHYNNWEMLAQCGNLQMKHQGVGIYTPLTNKYFEKKFSQSRGRYQIVLLPKRDVTSYFAENKDQIKAVMFGADQAPSLNTKRVYWMNFLNQDTAVMFGTEKFAKEYNYPVLYVFVAKVKRGWYEVKFEVLEDDPQSAPYGSITEKHTRRLEAQIRENPEYYLWTHRRWKRKRSDYAEE